MDNKEFEQIRRAVDGTRDYLIRVRQEFGTIRNEPGKDGSRTPSRDRMVMVCHQLYGDVHVVATMVSQLLENTELSVAQRVSLKASLSQLENEIRMLQNNFM